MAPFGINGDKLFTTFFGTTSKSESNRTVGNTTVPMTGETTAASDVSWQQSMGVELHTEQTNPEEQAFFSDEDLAAFVNQYATDISPETAENVTESMNGILSVDMAALDAVPEEFQDAYMGHQVDGTADRVKNENNATLFASDIDSAVNGDAELLNIAGYIFNDAAERRAA